MRQVREGTFETNSSSTHSLVVTEQKQAEYIPIAKHIKIDWIDTDDYYTLETLGEKLSYLVSHIANKVKYSCNNYDELLEEITDNYEYRQLEKYIETKFDKKIRFPEDKNGIYNDDVEDIVEINHQLIPWGTGMVVEEVLDELINYREDKDGDRIEDDYSNRDGEDALSFEEKLDIYFQEGNYVAFGRD